MPSYGEDQKPAGIVLQQEKPVIGKRHMTSRDTSITNSLVIDNVVYKGNPALEAQK
tara:strand:+ start:528 stop:695 length:168 start_codon:yes stop_codon:yes gene_type:complete